MNFTRAYKPITAGLVLTAIAAMSWLGAGTQSVQAQIPSVMADGQPMPSLAPMIKQVSPTVVGISVLGSVEVRGRRNLFDDPEFRRFFGIPDQDQSPRRRRFSSGGSGVIVDGKQGYILTNAHVIENAEEIQVTLLDNRTLSAEIVGTDPQSDVAVIKVDAKDLTEIKLGNSSQLEVGDFVVAIGNPFGQRNTVTSGIVSAKGRSNVGVNNDAYQDFIQTDASINPGNSGGALVNLRGELVGINSQIISTSGGNVGIGFAIPVNMANALMAQIIEFGEVQRGLLGVNIQTYTPELAEVWGTDQTSGALVQNVVEGSAAESAGIVPGDLIIGVNGTPVVSSTDLRNKIGLLRVGAKAELDVVREGRRRTIVAKVRGAPGNNQPVAARESDDRPSTIDNFHPGLMGAQLGEMERSSRGDIRGVMVFEVERGSRAAANGLQPGDIITNVRVQGAPASSPIENLRDLRRALDPDKRAILRIERQDGSGSFVLIRD